MAENGAFRVAALGFLGLRSLVCPIKGEVFVGNGAVVAVVMGLMGVAGASWGTEDTA
jgi:hypothetical protein